MGPSRKIASARQMTAQGGRPSEGAKPLLTPQNGVKAPSRAGVVRTGGDDIASAAGPIWPSTTADCLRRQSGQHRRTASTPPTRGGTDEHEREVQVAWLRPRCHEAETGRLRVSPPIQRRAFLDHDPLVHDTPLQKNRQRLTPRQAAPYLAPVLWGEVHKESISARGEVTGISGRGVGSAVSASAA